MRDEDIDFSDIPLLDESFWREAKVVQPERKQRLTIRLDHDLLEWLKKAAVAIRPVLTRFCGLT
jgi:hypothetical protein